MATNHGVRGSNPFLPDEIKKTYLNPFDAIKLTISTLSITISEKERWQSWSIASDLKSDEV